MKLSITSVLTLSLLIFLSLPIPSFTLKLKCHPDDRKALFRIKKALGNPYLLASWRTEYECCEWYLVRCHPVTSRIYSLDISDGEISGQIPDAVADLPYLESLTFRKLSNLTGQIPYVLTKLTHLTFMRLSWTNLSGPVPSFLSQLKNLTYIDLSFNDLSGTIPPELSTLPNLGALHLDRNKLTGTIPESFGHFTSPPPDLYLSHNQLTGAVPKSLGSLDFTRIDLSRNKLVGDISFLFGSKKTTQVADFSRNLFEFDMTKLKLPASLIFLDLNHNKIFGSLPTGYKLPELQQFNVSYNRLCGRIPKDWSLQKFTSFEYFHNRCLCGAPLPACK